MRAWKADEQRLVEASRKKRAQNRHRRRILWSAGIVAVFLIAVSSIVAWRLQRAAIEQTAQAISSKLAAQTLANLDDQLDLALLLSLEAYQTMTTPTFEARSSLLTGLQYSPYLITFLHGNSSIECIAFSPDNKTLASGSSDKTIILWEIATRQHHGKPLIGHKGAVLSVAFSPDSRILVSGSNPGTIIWDLNIKSWLSRACKIANRNLKIDEWRQYVDKNVLSYRPTCPDCPIHPSFIEYGRNLARNGDVDGAMRIFKRAKELDAMNPNLKDLDPKAEAQKLAAEWRSQK